MRVFVWCVLIGVGCGGAEEGSGDENGSLDARAGGGDGGGVIDSGSVPQVLDGDCDLVYTQRSDNDTDDRFSETRTYYAEFDVSPEDRFRVKRCGQEWYGEDPSSECQAGWTCTGNGPAPAADCWVANDGEFVADKLRAWCGYQSESRSLAAGPITQSGWLHTSVSVEVE